MRYLALNSLNNAMPQAIDRMTNAGFIVSGLWNSLGVEYLIEVSLLPHLDHDKHAVSACSRNICCFVICDARLLLIPLNNNEL